MATLVLRQIKGIGITDNEMDSNFSNLNRDSFLSVRNSTPWVATTAFSKEEILNVADRFYRVTVAGTTSSTAPIHTTGSVVNGTATLEYMVPAYYSAVDVLNKVKSLDGINSGLDADVVRGLTPYSTMPGTTDKSSIVIRDSSGNFVANTITATLNGNASTATSAVSANNANTLNSLSSTQLLQQASDNALAVSIALG